MLIAVALAVQTAACAHVLDNWHWRNPLPQGNSLSDIVYGTGLLVAVGEVGTILTSPDGTNWTQRASGVTDALKSCVYANGRFVAVGDFGVIVTSDDAINWIPRFSPAFYRLNGITYGRGLFVAVGDETTVLTSPDGVTWTQRASGSIDLADVAFGGNRFVAVGTGVFTSLDGINWTHHHSQRSFETVHWGNGKFVAGIRADRYAATSLVAVSSDGERWDEYGYNSFPITVEAVAFVGGTWMAAAGNTSGNARIYQSQDAVNWSRVTDVDLPISAFASKDGALLGSTFRGSFVMSQDMATWFDPLSKVPQFRGLFADVANGHLGYAGANYKSVVFSQDGTSWTNSSSITNLSQYGSVLSIAYGQGVYVAAGQYGSIRVSSDGVTWIDPLFDLNLEGFNSDVTVVFDNGLFLAVPHSGTNLLISSDGYEWRLIDVTATFGSLLYPSLLTADGRFVLTQGNRIGFSENGTDWVIHENSAPVTGVAYENGLFLATTYSGALISRDGTNWTEHRTPPGIGSVVGAGGFFLALPMYPTSDTSYRGALWSSRDGIEWTRHDIATHRGLFNIHYVNGSFLLTGLGDTVLQSDPVISLRLNRARQLEISGPANRTCTIEISDYPSGPWRPLTNVTLTAMPSQLTVQAPTDVRFFRALLATAE